MGIVSAAARYTLPLTDALNAESQTSGQPSTFIAGRFDDWCRVAYFAVPVILLMMWRY